MAPLRYAVHMSARHALIPCGRRRTPTDPRCSAPLEPRLAMLADDLAWWMRALATARAADG